MMANFNRCALLVALALGLGLGLGLGKLSSDNGASKRPNVLVIMTDDQGMWHQDTRPNVNTDEWPIRSAPRLDVSDAESEKPDRSGRSDLLEALLHCRMVLSITSQLLNWQGSS